MLWHIIHKHKTVLEAAFLSTEIESEFVKRIVMKSWNHL